MGLQSLAAKLSGGEYVILDGGMGTEIKRRGIAAGSSELSVAAMVDSPGAIREIHEDFIRAGAAVIITNTYICNSGKLARIGWDESGMSRINEMAVKAAIEARSTFPDRDVVIAGSLGPLSQSYNPDAVHPYEKCLSDYRAQARILANAGVDVILVETCTKIHEAVAGVTAAVELGMPAWAGFVSDAQGRVKSGESILDAQTAVKDAGASVMFINCCQVSEVTAAFEHLHGNEEMPLGAYAQGAVYEGSGWDFEESMSPEQYLSHAVEWARLGARAIGGCCGTATEHITALANADFHL